MISGRWIFVSALFGLAACSQSGPSNDSADPAADSADPDAPVAQAPYNIGDVETSTKLSIQLAQKSQGQNVRYSEIETQRGDLAIVEATFSQPYPAQIWLVSTAKTSRGYRANDTIVIRQRILLEGRDEPIARQAFVWSGTESLKDPKTLEVDLVPFLADLSGSVLVHARVDIFWLLDTDPTPIDPAGDFSSAQHVEKLSNSMRISFQ